MSTTAGPPDSPERTPISDPRELHRGLCHLLSLVGLAAPDAPEPTEIRGADGRREWRFAPAPPKPRLRSHSQVAPRTATRARGAGTPKARGGAKRSNARSGDSGDDGSDEPEPPSGRLCIGECGRTTTPRSDNCGSAACRKRIQRQRAKASAPATISLGHFCACGCQRSLEGKRAGTKFFSASCCTKAWRAEQRDQRQPLEADLCQCESGFFYRDADGDAVCGLCGCWLAKRRDLRVDRFDFFDAFMRANGPTVIRRSRSRDWRTSRQQASA